MAKKKKAPARKSGKKKKSRGQGLGAFTVLVIMVLLTVIVVLVTKKAPFEGKDPSGKKEPVSERQKKHEGDISASKDMRPEPRNGKAKDTHGEGKSGNEHEQKARDVKVFFLVVDDASEKIRMVSVRRTVAKGDVLEQSLLELLKGPASAEKSKGYISALPAGLKLRSAAVRNGNAVLDFNGALEQGASGSILLGRVDQIVYTATQFEGVKGVVLKINGSTRSTIGSDGLSVSGPLHRRPQ